jgi:hypothetical protein
VANLEEIDAITLQTGDDPRGLVKLPQFQDAVPLASCAVDCRYDGWFPAAESAIPWWLTACELELPDDPSGILPGYEIAPWLHPGSKVELFNQLLAAGSLAGAWLTLNSRGWQVSEAKRALAKLAGLSGDLTFGRLADAWTSVAEGDQSY